MEDILRMSREEILNLKVNDIFRLLTAEEVVHIAMVLGAFWTYDYGAAYQGRVGMHAILKSRLHSDGFFVSRILLDPENTRNIISRQIVARLRSEKILTPDYIIGVPDGATALGLNIAEIMGTRKAHMEKIDGRIVLKTEIPAEATVLLVEDFCTRGTGFKEAVAQVINKQKFAKFLPIYPVIINRGGLKEICVEKIGFFKIIPVVEQRIQDWDPNIYCPLCVIGSIAIKPKLTDENWQLLTASQLQ